MIQLLSEDFITKILSSFIVSSKQNKDQSYTQRNAETDVSKNALLNSS